MPSAAGNKRSSDREDGSHDDGRHAKRPRPSSPGKAAANAGDSKPGAEQRKAVGPAQATSEADEQKKLQLLDALAAFRQQQQERQLFLEVDVAAEVDPDALVGRQVRVLWPDDAAWYLGTVTAYDSASGRHQVRAAQANASPQGSANCVVSGQRSLIV
jgi:hypothetical protein